MNQTHSGQENADTATVWTLVAGITTTPGEPLLALPFLHSLNELVWLLMGKPALHREAGHLVSQCEWMEATAGLQLPLPDTVKRLSGAELITEPSGLAGAPTKHP